MNVHEKLRLCDISRWGMVNISRPQSVAEHSFNVVVITEEICKRFQLGYTETVEAILVAVRHDFMEVLTGDVASPTKMRMMNWPEFERGCDADQYDQCKSGSPLSRAIVKCADYIEAAYYLKLYGVGQNADKVAGRVTQKFEGALKLYSKEFPNTDWVAVEELYFEIKAAA